MILATGWVAEKVVIWVRLGMEIGGGLLGVEALDGMKKKRKKELGFAVEGGRDLGASALSSALSLLDDKRQMRRRRAEVLSTAEGVEARWGFKSSTDRSSSWQRGQPEATCIECPPGILLRAERGRR